MSDFDQFDDELANALRSRSGTATGSVGAAHEAVLARASHVRRRRAAVVSGVAMVALLIGGVTLLRTGAGDTLAPADTGLVLPSVPDDSADSTEVSTNTEQSGVDTATAPRTTDDSADVAASITPPGTTLPSTVPDSTLPAAAPTTPPDISVTVASTAPATTLPSTSQATASSTSTDVPSTTTIDDSSTTSTSEVSLPPIAPFTRTYQSLGGSITVEWNGSALSLLDVSAAAGFEPEVEDNEPLRIRVRFRGDDDDSRIEIRVNGGELIESIS